MKTSALNLLLTGFATLASVTAKVNYDGFKVYRIPHDENTAKIENVISALGLATWKNNAKHGNADIVVPPGKLKDFEAKTRGMSKAVMHEDLGAAIAAEENADAVYTAGSLDESWFTGYHAYSDHLKYLDDLKAAFPNNSEIVTSGTTVLGRPITGIHFWGKDGKDKKPAIIFHSTVHAREWVTTMVNEYVAYQLITNYNKDSAAKAWVDNYDWYIFPVVNPDGFIYTQTENRMWRKNRQNNTGASASCQGRDINRNWPYKWNGEGSSNNPCAEDYRGAAAGDTPENRGLREFIEATAKKNGLKLYIDWHSYSQLFMYPYGYSCTASPTRGTEFGNIARGAVAAIKAVYGTAYQYGPICSTIYQVAGGGVDYMNNVVKADYTFTLELRDTGKYGFILPPEQITPTAIETYEGVKYILQNLK